VLIHNSRGVDRPDVLLIADASGLGGVSVVAGRWAEVADARGRGPNVVGTGRMDMGCLFVIFAGAFPRFADIILWIARPNLFLAPFGGNWLWPLLGILFLPFTTLLYVVMWSPATGLQGGDWFWIMLAVILDISHAAGGVYSNRDRVPGMAPPP
jgi:hypothetical protein